MERVKYLVVRDYTEADTGHADLGYATCALFYNEADAREYYRWQKRRLDSENKKRFVPRIFKWRLEKIVEFYEENGSVRTERKWLDE